MLPLLVLAKAPSARPWQKVDGCQWKSDRCNDGDSFHVITGDESNEIVARLYSVDTPEAEPPIAIVWTSRPRISESTHRSFLKPAFCRSLPDTANSWRMAEHCAMHGPLRFSGGSCHYRARSS